MVWLVEYQTYDLRAGFNSHQSFGHWLKLFANFTNLTNLLNRNLGKTQMFNPGGHTD